jgi:hypothetical protein
MSRQALPAGAQHNRLSAPGYVGVTRALRSVSCLADTAAENG